MAVDGVQPSLSFNIGVEKVLNGACINGKRDFNLAKFRVVDQDGNGLNYFKILEGHILPSKSDAAMRGKILETGKLDAAAIELLKSAEGEKMTAFVKLLDKSTDKEMSVAFHFYVNVRPEIIFGDIVQGQKKADKKKVAEIYKLFVKYRADRELIEYKVVSGTISVDEVEIKGSVLEDGTLDENARLALSQAAGKQVTILVLYSDPTGVEKRTALVFTVED